ncbi:MAG: NAD(P)(+) transhydrogenase (Re/Si-specific) subunit beta [Candidatus Hydrogenedentes bacterium]|nr:NAD(P)(+) transhydrogenase (Re/Si-specific) subunit beta [Candidatus Hydrogenedentota bacterium]
MVPRTVVELGYIVAAVLFIYGLKMLGSADTARRGNMVSALGMFLAVLATVVSMEMSWSVIIGCALVGALIGIVAAIRVPMTSMPEFVALFNGSGGIASLFVGWAEYHTNREVFDPQTDIVTLVSIFFAVLIGGVTFTGSLVACGKLAEIPWRIQDRLKKKPDGLVSNIVKAVRPPLDLMLQGTPVMYKGQQIVNGLLVLTVLGSGVAFVMNPAGMYVPFLIAVAIAFVLGVLFTIPIGGADMPVVISLLNSYSGLAACAAGFVIGNTVLIVAGSLVGASGLVLTRIMCKAMNRSLANVLFSGFGSAKTASVGAAVEGEAKPITAEDAYYVLEAASSVVFVPGYGMAVAQAQHAVRELGDVLEANGAEVKYAVHPVAGRMPGHMNVLLAEANVPYELLVEMDDINPIIENVDVAIVIGANDVVNPAAREDESSPIYGMPIINVDHARTVFVLKRSMRPGFAGIDNPLFFKENTRMLFGDAKHSVEALLTAFKS